MEERDLYYVSEYHRQLIATSTLARALREAKPVRPGIRDYILLRVGSYLISLGQRLRSASTYEKPVELAQDCA
jgi:hypothetical protein